MASIQATVLLFPFFYAVIVADFDTLHWDILLAFSNESITTKHILTNDQ